MIQTFSDSQIFILRGNIIETQVMADKSYWKYFLDESKVDFKLIDLCWKDE